MTGAGGFVTLAAVAVVAVLSGGEAAAQDAPGIVSLDCGVSPEGRVGPCTVVSEPAGGGYGEIALSRAASARLVVPPEGIPAGATVQFETRVEAPVPEGLRASEADPRPGVITDPRWDIAPVIEFPTRASQRGIESGQARARCVVAPDGALTGCVVLSEHPVGADFGAAVLSAASTARLSPASVASARPGAIVEINSTFRLAQETAQSAR
ncbi:energy transducer TonB [Brevundimonas sp. GCM10030266]|uniref:energy transducer TonB family protein n=1 Tax=Brevundimonas sp. GCM10030266 TaxID=3273386 RepID=UPI0036185DD2